MAGVRCYSMVAVTPEQEKRCALARDHEGDHVWLESPAVVGRWPIVVRWNDSVVLRFSLVPETPGGTLADLGRRR